MSLHITNKYNDKIISVLKTVDIPCKMNDNKLYVSLEAMKEILPDKNENQILKHFRELIKSKVEGNYYLIWAICINGGYLLEIYDRTGRNI